LAIPTRIAVRLLSTAISSISSLGYRDGFGLGIVPPIKVLLIVGISVDCGICIRRAAGVGIWVCRVGMRGDESWFATSVVFALPVEGET
jgi:hypothetical protein